MLSIRGSYAGAIGWAQFIPRSYRTLAVDFDGRNGKDLWTAADAVGSIGNYFKESGWRKDGPVSVPAQVKGHGYKILLERTRPGKKLTIDPADLPKYGVTAQANWAEGEKVGLYQFVTDSGPHYVVARRNFQAITRYNHSRYYAQVADELRRALIAETKAVPNS